MPYKDPEKAKAQKRASYERCRAAMSPEQLEESRQRNRGNIRRWRADNPELDRKRRQTWCQANREKARGYTRKWQAANREHRRAYKHAYASTHRTDTNARQRDWFARHPGKNSEYNRRHGHRRRVLLRGRPSEPIDFQFLYERDRGRCHICKKRVSFKAATLDHLIPVIHGGHHLMSNLRLAHFSCNCSRNHRGPAQLLLFS